MRRQSSNSGSNHWLRMLGATAALAAMIGAGACNRNETAAKSEPAADPDQVLKNQTADVEKRTDAELNDWDRRIDQLKAEQKRVKSKALKDQWKNAVADLDRKKGTVKDRLSDVKSAGADTWQTANNNLDVARADLKKSYDEVIQKLGKTVTPPLQPDSSM